MQKQQLRYRENKSRPIDATDLGPVLRLTGVAAAAAGLALLLFLVILPLLRGDASAAGKEAEPGTASALPPQPSSTPHPIWSKTAVPLELPSDAAIPFIADPSICDGKLVFVTGREASDCTRILSLSLLSGEISQYTPALTHGSVRWPCISGDTLAYLDAAEDGGGTVHVASLSSGEDKALLEVERGVPRLFMEYPYLTLTERSAEGGGKVRLFDLTTMEGVTAAVLGDSACASSMPCIDHATLYWAGTDGGQSYIRVSPINGSDPWDYSTGTGAHDPKASERSLAWLSSPHGEDADLYACVDYGTPVCIARGVADFGVSGNIVVYSRDETVYSCVLGDTRSYVLSPAGSRVQLIAAERGYVLWRDVTGEEPVTYYMNLE